MDENVNVIQGSIEEEMRRIAEDFEETNSVVPSSQESKTDGQSVPERETGRGKTESINSFSYSDLFTSVYEHPEKLNWIDLTDRFNVYMLINNDGRNLFHLRNNGVKIGYKLEDQALRQTPLALAFCRHQTRSRITHAIQRDFRSYLGVKDPNKKTFLFALTNMEQARDAGTVSDEECSSFLKAACNSRICDAYLSNRIADINPEYITYIPDGNLVTYKRYEAAVLKDPGNIRFIPTNNPHREKLLDLAISRDPRCVIKCNNILPKFYSKAMLAARSLGNDTVKAIYDSMPGSYKGMFNSSFIDQSTNNGSR